MFERLIRLSLAHRWLVVLGSALLLVFGAVTAMGVPVDVFPEFAPPQVVIQTEAPGYAPEDVEALVTVPLESALNGTANVTDVRSQSAIGLSVVTVIFKQGTDTYTDRQLVNEKLTSVSGHLPVGVTTPTMSPITSPIGDVLKIALVSEKTSLMDLRTLADWTIRNRLLAVPGVSRVLVLGGDREQYQVLVHPQAMAGYGITLDQVSKALQESNLNAPGGFYRTGDREYLVRGVGRVRSLADLERSVVTSHAGTPITLAQVATIQRGAAPPIGMGSVDGRPAVIITVSKQPDANTLETSHAVEQALSELKAHLPADVQVVTLFRQANFIETSIRNVLSAMRDGALLVVVILLLFLFNWRTALISILAIPLSLLISVLTMRVLGITLNTMTLGGLTIAIGIVVDDAIVDVENVDRRLREHAATGTFGAIKDVVYAASCEIRGSVVYATLILLLVLVPVFTLTGLAGRLFAPLAIAYMTAIAASLLVAVVVTPALCLILLPHPHLKVDDSRAVEWLKRRYGLMLDAWVFPHANAIVASSVAVLAVSGVVFAGLGRSFLPEFQEGNLVIHASGMPGTSLTMMSRVGRSLEATFRAIPGVQVAGQRAGRASGDDDAGGSNFSEMDVALSPTAERTPTMREIRRALGVVPGVSEDVGSFISDRINEVLSGSQGAIVVKLFGPDLPTLRLKAQEIEAAMAKVRGMVDLQTEPQMQVEQLDITFDRRAAARYGLTVGQLSQDVETLFNGRSVSQVVSQGRTFDLYLWSDEAAHADPATLERTLIDTPTGVRVPLSALARVAFEPGPTTINRENVSRRIVISANATGVDLGRVVSDIQHQIATTVQLPPGYFVVYGGQFESQQRAQRELFVFGALAILGIFVLLTLAFRSWRSAALVLANLPLALVGGVFAVVATGGVMSVASLIGLITLFGISTRNGILMVAHYNHLARAGTPFDALLRQGSLERLSPVLMTALAAGLGMLPLALSSGSGRELEQPLAVVILGGMLTSTLLTLIVVPALYRIFGRHALHITVPQER